MYLNYQLMKINNLEQCFIEQGNNELLRAGDMALTSTVSTMIIERRQ
jgi:hypothetical protein